jgi:hypothetical protein
MSNADYDFDFNNAGPQRSVELIPDGTVVIVQMIIRAGGKGNGGYEKDASDGNSTGLDCEFIVVWPEKLAERKYKVFQWLTLRGNKPGHAEAGDITRKMLRAILESAYGILPNDIGEVAEKARRITGWHALDNLRFVAQLGVRPPSGGYAAKNVIREVVTADKQAWQKPTQIVPTTPQGGSTPPSSTPPAGSVSRPDWAKSE